MVGGVYFWAGFHKLNISFCFNYFPWVISTFYTYTDEQSLLNVIMALVLVAVPIRVLSR